VNTGIIFILWNWDKWHLDYTNENKPYCSVKTPVFIFCTCHIWKNNYKQTIEQKHINCNNFNIRYACPLFHILWTVIHNKHTCSWFVCPIIQCTTSTFFHFWAFHEISWTILVLVQIHVFHKQNLLHLIFSNHHEHAYWNFA
jgi:hypothetical protein